MEDGVAPDDIEGMGRDFHFFDRRADKTGGVPYLIDFRFLMGRVDGLGETMLVTLAPSFARKGGIVAIATADVEDVLASKVFGHMEPEFLL